MNGHAHCVVRQLVHVTLRVEAKNTHCLQEASLGRCRTKRRLELPVTERCEPLRKPHEIWDANKSAWEHAFVENQWLKH